MNALAYDMLGLDQGYSQAIKMGEFRGYNTLNSKVRLLIGKYPF